MSDTVTQVLNNSLLLSAQKFGNRQFRENPSINNLRILLPSYEPSAAGYYRLLVPLFEMKRQQLSAVLFKDDVELMEDEFKYERSIEWANTISYGRINDPEILQVTRELQKFGTKIITDQDDYPEAVALTVQSPASRIWTEDRLETNRELIRSADLLTVSVPYLAEVYGKLRTGPTVVLPNCIDALNPRWNFPRVDNGKQVVIGWMAGPSHFADSEFAGEVITRVLKENPNTIFKAIGFIDDWMFDLPKEQRKLVPGQTNMNTYVRLLDNVDIGIAPVIDNVFNRGKSDLKYLEYTMAGCVSVVSDVEPYKIIPGSVVNRLDNNVDIWVNRLNELVRDKYLRMRQMDKAKKYVINNRTIYSNVDKWHKAFKSLYN